MLILAFDTTSPHGSAALYQDSDPLAELQPESTVSYSIALFEMVERLLLKAGAHLPDVELFAATTGPGSFTGIRVGLAAAQGWAKALGRPVCGVSVLEAMVEAACPQGHAVAVPLLDARRGEFYLGVFRHHSSAKETSSSDEAFLLSDEARALGASEIRRLLNELGPNTGERITLISGAHDQAALELIRSLHSPLEHVTVSSHLAGAVARVALRAARAGRLQKPEELNALYIRRSDAELNWRE